MEEKIKFLQDVDLFTGLSEEDLSEICAEAEELHFESGEVIFSEGDLSDRVYVVKTGEVEIMKISDGRLVQLAERGAGAIIGEISLLVDSPRTASVRALTKVSLLSFPLSALIRLLEKSSGAARKMLDTVISRMRSNELLLRQSERMAQLGELTAGIAHELNNPAASVRRGAEQLTTAMAWRRRAQLAAVREGISEDVLEAIAQMVEERFAGQGSITAQDPITRADQITEMEDRLEQRGISNSWEVAPELIDMGTDLDAVWAVMPGASSEAYSAAIDWLAASFSVHSIIKGIEQGADQISEIVRALKMYSYVDQAPTQLVDIHDGLDNTLIMLRHLWRAGITVEREYDRSLARILAFGGELNQVWTNILVNAIEAMDGKGRIIIRTFQEEGFVVVEIEDNGPGIPVEIQPKVFNLYYTSKPVGKGSGLGLSISSRIVQKHRGEITVESEPGKTVMRVKIPVNQ